jgi:hypothetical protein
VGVAEISGSEIYEASPCEWKQGNHAAGMNQLNTWTELITRL